MKSGLYITEIVKRLYQSEGLKKAYLNKNERLKHIFEKQVDALPFAKEGTLQNKIDELYDN